MKFFDCLVKFWTLPYGPKVQCSGRILKRPTCSVLRPLYVHLSFGILQIQWLIHEGQTPPVPNREIEIHRYEKCASKETHVLTIN